MVLAVKLQKVQVVCVLAASPDGKWLGCRARGFVMCLLARALSMISRPPSGTRAIIAVETLCLHACVTMATEEW